MSESPYVFDVTEANFDQLVVQNSHHVPVLVDFWAPWCGPCKMLVPVLTQLAATYNGKFLLAKINSDENQELAARFQVRGIPAVKLVRNGKVVDEFTGAQPESAVRAFLEPHLPRESNKLVEQALAEEEAGRMESATALFTRAVGDDPDNHLARIAFAAYALRQGDAAQANAQLTALPADKQLDPEVEALKSQLRLIEATRGAPDSDTLEARLAANPVDNEAAYQLAVRHIQKHSYEPAIELLLGIIQRDRAFRDDGPRKTLLDLFNLLGSDPLVKRYRSRLAMLLH